MMSLAVEYVYMFETVEVDLCYLLFGGLVCVLACMLSCLFQV